MGSLRQVPTEAKNEGNQLWGNVISHFAREKFFLAMETHGKGKGAKGQVCELIEKILLKCGGV